MRRVFRKLAVCLSFAALALTLTATAQAAGLAVKGGGDSTVTSTASVTITNSADIRERPAAEVTLRAYQAVGAQYSAETNELTYCLADWVADAAPGVTADELIGNLNTAGDNIVGAGDTEQNKMLNTLAEALAKALAAGTDAPAAAAIQTGQSTEGSFALTLPVGAYLVTADAPGMTFLNMMVSVNAQAAKNGADWEVAAKGAALKGRAVAVEKKIVLAAGAGGLPETLADAAAAQAGDALTFRIRADVPRFPLNAANRTFRVVDTPANLSIVQDSVEVKGHAGSGDSEGTALAKDAAYALSFDAAGAMTVDFTDAYDKVFGREDGTYPYSYVTVTYRAKLLSGAQPGAGAEGGALNKNTVKYQYGDAPYTAGAVGELTDGTAVYTYGAEITKKGDTEGTLLAGAEFEVRRESDGKPLTFVKDGEDGSYRVADGTESADLVAPATAGESGKLTLSGLGEGTYTLKETKAPTGYSLNGNVLKVTVQAKKDDSGEATAELDHAAMTDEETTSSGVTVEAGKRTWTGPAAVDGKNAYFAVSLTDTRLPELPATGGTGTAVFTVTGVALMLAAVILLFLSGRRRKTK